MYQVDASIFFSQPDACQEKLFSYRMLGPFRKYVIGVKDTLRVAIEKAGSFWSLILLFIVMVQTAYKIRNKVGKVTKENSVYISTHRLLEHREKLAQLHKNPGRSGMCDNAFDILIAVNEHDPYYGYLMGWEAEQIANDINTGRWPPKGEPPKVLKPCWNKEG